MSRRRKSGPSQPRGNAPQRVGEEIRMKVMDLLVRGVRDPRLAGVHVTRVDMTADLSRANLYFRTLPGGPDPAEAEEACKRAAGFLRKEIGRSLRLRATPELVFQHDDLPEQGDRIEELLRQARGDGAVADADA